MRSSKTRELMSGFVGTNCGERQAAKAERAVSPGTGMRKAFLARPRRWDFVLRATRAFEGLVERIMAVGSRKISDKVSLPPSPLFKQRWVGAWESGAGLKGHWTNDFLLMTLLIGGTWGPSQQSLSPPPLGPQTSAQAPKQLGHAL